VKIKALLDTEKTNPIVYRAAIGYILLKHVNTVFGKYADILGEGNNFIDFYIPQFYPLYSAEKGLSRKAMEMGYSLIRLLFLDL